MLILLADDHSLVRDGLKHTLADLSPEIDFIEAATAEDVIQGLTGDTTVDLVLLDLIMPGSNGFELLTQVCNEHPELTVVILSGSADPSQMRKALDIGAAGFITLTSIICV